MRDQRPHEAIARVAAAEPPRRRSRLGNLLVWLPLAAVLLIIATTLLGIKAVPWATAAPVTSSTSQTINGNVGVVVWIDAVTGCGSTTIPNLAPGDRGITPAACSVTFGTNGSLGADLNLVDSNTLGNDTMRCIATCTDPSIAEDSAGAFPAGPATAALPAQSSTESWFVMSLDAISGPVTVADMAVNAGGGAIAGTDWAVVEDAAYTACHTTANTSGVTDGVCDFYWAVETTGTQSAGAYRADIAFEASER